ncbi:helix-turn-helix domain-containing protein [Micromonospora sp. NPDC007271]|uniref:helix-turn-helix domain-containing protein n=1 Tax=Micromonospora sp. NPDC007271 TaxID=3154587 RepID=UPI0034064F16
MFNRTFGCVRLVWNRTLAGGPRTPRCGGPRTRSARCSCGGVRVSRAYRKSHTPPQRSCVFSGGRNHSASLSAPGLSTGKGPC